MASELVLLWPDSMGYQKKTVDGSYDSKDNIVIQQVIREVGGGNSYPLLTEINYSDWAEEEAVVGSRLEMEKGVVMEGLSSGEGSSGWGQFRRRR